MLVRLLYASRAREPITAKTIEALLEQSRRNNLEHGITGVLCTVEGGDVFMQVVEGARAEVNRLYSNIVRDDRHDDVLLLDYAEIEQRRFAAWRMGRIDLGQINRNTILRFSPRATLDPWTLSGRQALALLEEIVATMPA